MVRAREGLRSIQPALEGDPRLTAEAALEPGPSTVRPDTAPDKLAERLADAAEAVAERRPRRCGRRAYIDPAP